MCANFFVELSKAELAVVYGIEAVEHLDPRELYPYRPSKTGAAAKAYNLAPTVTQVDGQRSLHFMRWGLLPPWARSDQEPVQPFNAQAEGVATKPMFRAAFRNSRCLVPVSAFYEHRTTASGKVRMAFSLPVPFAFAGLYHVFDGLATMAFITAASSEWFSGTHHRQPVLLTGDAMDWWLAPDTPSADLERMLTPWTPPMLERVAPKV